MEGGWRGEKSAVCALGAHQQPLQHLRPRRLDLDRGCRTPLLHVVVLLVFKNIIIKKSRCQEKKGVMWCFDRVRRVFSSDWVKVDILTCTTWWTWCGGVLPLLLETWSQLAIYHARSATACSSIFVFVIGAVEIGQTPLKST